ncbi:MAG: biopolymer transporter ExbD [Bacteroidaceae bacterium]|nr:biopolymer transporter ExbD [Bacteroidaceae bacterium]MBP9637141.1 biopolymer transporter ExbD [Bacteroidaceae bacterium]
MDAPQQSDNKTGKSKQKKLTVRVDFTPMVDMNMLLITFFMLCTTLSKPQTMEINMPSNDDKITDEQKTKVKESLAVTLLLDAKDQLYYYEGIPDWNNPEAIKRADYTNQETGIRRILMRKNAAVVNKVKELKQQKRNLQITQQQYDVQVKELRNGKNTPTVIIKATDEATYKNLVDALDEMQICNIGKYVIVPIADTDKDLIKAVNGKL